jgi:hypothetical protein
MAQTFAKLTKYAGGRDVWGGHGVFFATYTGPASYVNSGTFATSGEIIDSVGALTELGAANTPMRGIDAIPTIQTVSGTYEIKFFPTASGAGATPSKRWVAHWYTIISAGVEVANTTNLSAETAIVMIIGG